jgi:hypothetical protein
MTEQDKKPTFGPETLNALVAQMNSKFPSELTTHWRRFVTKNLDMTEGQRKSIDDIPDPVAKCIHEFFVQAAAQLKNGGQIYGKIVKRPEATRTVAAVHEVHLSVETPQLSPQLTIVIAHCDADCRNWGWGPA